LPARIPSNQQPSFIFNGIKRAFAEVFEYVAKNGPLIRDRHPELELNLSEAYALMKEVE